MELSRPPLVVAFELSEKRKAIVADALAGVSAVVYLTELDEAARAEALRNTGALLTFNTFSDHAPVWIELRDASRSFPQPALRAGAKPITTKRSAQGAKPSAKPSAITSGRRPLLVIDGDSFAHRAFHALPKNIRRKGHRPAGAILGFANLLLRIYREEKPRAVLVAWDTLEAETYRHDYRTPLSHFHAELEFIELCRLMGLLTTASVAIDGSKFKAVNTRDKNFTRGKVERRRAQLETSVARYLAQLDTADLQEPSEELAAKTAYLKEKLVKLESEMQRLAAMEKLMLASPDQQISLTDPDSRSMATSGRGSGVVGYNVQVAVDTEHHLIVTHEVTNDGSDRAQLANIASQAKEVLGVDELEAVADRGYYSGEEILACHKAGIAVTLPKPMTSGVEARGRFGKQDFVYLGDEDVYRCPAGEKLTYHYTNEENGQRLRRYWTNACRDCALKPRCTTGTQRRIARWEHENVLEAFQKLLDKNPQAMRQRRETVEHPFGTLKMRMGATHFLMKRLPKVATEMALHVLAYNLTRVMNIMGIEPLMAAIRA